MGAWAGRISMADVARAEGVDPSAAVERLAAAGRLRVEVWRTANDGQPYRLQPPALVLYRIYQRLRGTATWRVVMREDRVGPIAWISPMLPTREDAEVLAERLLTASSQMHAPLPGP
jgi:hypothetical protein